MIDHAGDLARLVGTRRRLGELAQLGEAPGEPVPREDGYQGAGLHSLEPPITPNASTSRRRHSAACR